MMILANLPAFLIGLIVAVYWARVLRMTQKLKKSIGHSANLIPPEPVGRLTRVIWAPIVGLWIVLPLLAPFIHTRRPFLTPVFRLPILACFAVLVALFAYIFTWICWKRMGKSWRMGIDPNEKTQLIVTGPYQRLRHPIYALSSLLMLATMLAYPTPLMILVGFLHLLLLQLEARREEAYLRRVHGSAYEDYCHRVGGFLPRW
jgi:protein-S-isoprenylcysteine O-methyltransferase Ste14